MKLQSHGPTSVRVTLDALEKLTDPEHGIVSTYAFYQGQPDEPAFVHCHSSVQAPGQPNGGRIAAGGTALDEDTALAKALGEAVERYCINLYDPALVRVAPYAELQGSAIDPQRFVAYHQSQQSDQSYPFARPAADRPLSWVEGFSLTRNQSTWVPANMVHLLYQPLTTHDRFEQCPVSGYACGNTLEEAILNGIYEVVERDAFMIWWYHWLRTPGIDLTSFESPETHEMLHRYDHSPVRLFCSSITTDVGIPVALIGLTSWRSGWPATTVAMGSDLSMERAVGHALRELAANLLLVGSYLQLQLRPIPRSPEEVVHMEDHGLFYASPEMLPALDPLLRPSRWVGNPDTSTDSPTDVKADIERCVRMLAAVDLEVIAVDVTAPEVEERGFKVVKILVPGMRPIDFGTAWQHLGGARLYEAPVRMGYEGTAADPDSLNRFPHPFP